MARKRRKKGSRSYIDSLAKKVDALAERFLCRNPGSVKEASVLMSTLEALSLKHVKLCALRSSAPIHSAMNYAHADADGFAGLDALPLHLQISILGWLPFQKLMQVRAVCSSWNSLLRSPALIQQWSTAAETDMWLVMSRECECPSLFKQFLAYSTSQHRLFPMPLDHPYIAACLGYQAALVRFGCSTGSGLQCPPMMCGSGAGGLLCCLVTGSLSPQHEIHFASLRRTCCWKHLPDCSEFSVLVFNPLTGAVHYLPSLPKVFGYYLSTPTRLSIHSHSGNHYYVVIQYSDYCDHAGQLIFNSMSGSWKHSIAPLWRFEFGTLSCLTEGDFFCWHRMMNDDDSCLNFYSLERDLWSKVKMSRSCLGNSSVLPYTDIRTATFLKCDNYILLAASLVDNLHGPMTSLGFAVWHLTIASQEVTATLLSFTPINTLQKALVSKCKCGVRRRGFRATFTTNGTHICMTGDDHVVYDLVNDCWDRPPRSDNGSFDYVGLSCFQPRWDADPCPPVSNKPSST